ncbi:ankyrin repeat domain-containing protein 7-like [Apteryx mantelli]|uniref:Ankyrin repeat domain-containing protein 7-like n=1 Tax=Apteryx mantelli TaxID=2696672 RepID=A0ABM4G8X7_9AVES
MKRLFGLFSKGQGPPPSPSGGASLPCVGAASELREKELGKLHRAAASGDLVRVRRPWWLPRLSINRRDKAKRTPLHLACANGHSEVVSYLVGNKCKLDPRDNFKRSPLMKAVQCQQEECVAILLAHGADPNLADVNGSTALHLAAIAPNTSLAGQLLEHNARIDARNEMGYTPLALAVSEHHEEMVEFLLKKGADVHARDQSERTPLMLAASAGDMSMIEVLLRCGADLSQEDVLGWTAEDCARTSGRARVSQHLVDSAVGEKVGEASAGGAKGVPALSTPPGAGAAGFALGACALASGGRILNRGGADEENPYGLFFWWLVLLKLTMFTTDFSGGIVDIGRMLEEEESDDSCPASEEENHSSAAKLRCMALGLRCDEDCKCGAGTQAVLLEMQEESPEWKGEEATGGPQVADAAEAPAGVREKATGSGENTAVRLGLNNTALFFLCS